MTSARFWSKVNVSVLITLNALCMLKQYIPYAYCS